MQSGIIITVKNIPLDCGIMMNSKRSKLVRDKIPELIRKRGKTPTYYPLTDADFRRELRDKLVEEACEVRDAGTDKKRVTEELADVREVLHAIAKIENIPWRKIQKQQRTKRKEHGGFKRKMYLVQDQRIENAFDEE